MEYDIILPGIFTADLPVGIKCIKRIISKDHSVGYPAIKYSFERFGNRAADCVILTDDKMLEFEDIEKEVDRRAALEVKKLYKIEDRESALTKVIDTLEWNVEEYSNPAALHAALILFPGNKRLIALVEENK